MANIGSFKRVEDGTISGEIRTLRFKTTARFVPVEDKTSEQSPDLRLFAPGKVELGAAWKKVSEPASPTTRSPSTTVLPAPVYAALLPTEADPDRFNLAWSRPRQQDDDGY